MSKFFSDEEMSCNCCGSVPEGGFPERLYQLLDDIRDKIGKPITVLSGYRCESHNAECGGVRNSQHLLGTACDITYDDIDVDALAEIAEQCNADGIGKYWSQGFCHIDVRGYTARWTEND